VISTQEKLGRALYMSFGSKRCAPLPPAGERFREASVTRGGDSLLIALASAPISSAHQGARSRETRVRSAPLGTYTLHPSCGAEGRVLQGLTAPAPLSALQTRDRSRCSLPLHRLAPPEGLPARLPRLRRLKEADAPPSSLHGKVRIVTLSFDPARASPYMMHGVTRKPRSGKGTEGCGCDFLTTASARELCPLVEGFDQISASRSIAPAHAPARSSRRSEGVLLIAAWAISAISTPRLPLPADFLTTSRRS